MITTLQNLDDKFFRFESEIHKTDFYREIITTFSSCFLISVVISLLISGALNGFQYTLVSYLESFLVVGVLTSIMWTVLRVNSPFRDNRAIIIGVCCFVLVSLVTAAIVFLFF